MVNDIQPNCKCGTKLAKVFAGDSATFICERTCRKCKAKWQVKVSPNIVHKPGVHAYPVELKCLMGAPRKRNEHEHDFCVRADDGRWVCSECGAEESENIRHDDE